MNRHLVAVEVRIESCGHQRVKLNCAALDEHRLESLDTQTMQCWRAVEHHRAVLNHLFQHFPDFGTVALDKAARSLNIGSVIMADQSCNHKWSEELERHRFWQSALVQLERRTHNDHRTARVVDALAQ